MTKYVSVIIDGASCISYKRIDVSHLNIHVLLDVMLRCYVLFIRVTTFAFPWSFIFVMSHSNLSVQPEGI